MQLEITIIDSLTCKPLKDAAVDVWHCNATGVYSDISSEDTLGETYLRGVQFTDKHGKVGFTTVTSSNSPFARSATAWTRG